MAKAMTKSPNWVNWVPVGLAGVAAALALAHMMDWVPRNLFYLNLERATFNGQPMPFLPDKLQPMAPQLAFGRGWLAWMRGDVPAAEAAWDMALRADAQYLPVIKMMAPADLPLAELAVQMYPDRAESWDWLGDLQAASAPAHAMTAYQKAAALSPLDNLIWEKLSSAALVAGDKDVAQSAAQTACDYVPIRNGACHEAARLAYEKGQWQTVIDYFERGYYPEHVEDWVILIRAAQKANEPDEATRLLAMAHHRLPADYESLVRATP